MPPFAEELLSRFRWIGGHADVLGLLSDASFLARSVAAPAEPFEASRVTKVAGWAETGSQALAARSLIEECRGRWAGLSLLVDQLQDDVRDRLDPVRAVVLSEQLPDE